MGGLAACCDDEFDVPYAGTAIGEGCVLAKGIICRYLEWIYCKHCALALFVDDFAGIEERQSRMYILGLGLDLLVG